MESSPIFFYGGSESRLSPKGQVTIPAQFRNPLPNEELKRGFVLVQGQAACLYLYTHSHFEVVKNNARTYFVESGNREAFRTFMEEAAAIDLDPQGRFVIPGVLREKAGLSGPDVLFVGLDNRIEIWNPTTRAKTRQDGAKADEWRSEHGERIFGL